ncbi:hypothetical protein BV25DRAFT_1946762 [Artomyces pyxidatus]|uniref:Uncharacterized protein n=1 Tax=Artomyces pyxidatus TaxID=48021 RepID=A0ACB8SDE6_9AGAM|nr:hypothetical protein BV25DRAFT_1946762 [Artomyces pyxidatus]
MYQPESHPHQSSDAVTEQGWYILPHDGTGITHASRESAVDASSTAFCPGPVAQQVAASGSVPSADGSSAFTSGVVTFQCMSASGDAGLGLGLGHSHSHGHGHSHGLGRLVPRSFVAPGHGPPFLVHYLVADGTRGVDRSLSVTALNQWYKFHSVVHGTCDAVGTLSASPRPLLLFDVHSFLPLVRKFMLWTIRDLRNVAKLHGVSPLLNERRTVPITAVSQRVQVPVIEDVESQSSSSDAESVEGSSFPEMYSPELRLAIIREWQEYMDPGNWVVHVCGVCGQKKFRRELLTWVTYVEVFPSSNRNMGVIDKRSVRVRQPISWRRLWEALTSRTSCGRGLWQHHNHYEAVIDDTVYPPKPENLERPGSARRAVKLTFDDYMNDSSRATGGRGE